MTRNQCGGVETWDIGALGETRLGSGMSEQRAVNEIDRRLGERVRGRRLELDMSQERLAELIGVTFQQVQKYEKGVNRIAASRLFDISAALEMPISAFFDGLTTKHGDAPEENDQRSADTLLATPDGRTLVRVFGTITNPRVRKRIVDLTLALAEEDFELNAKRR